MNGMFGEMRYRPTYKHFQSENLNARKRPLERPRPALEDVIKTDLR